MMTPGALSPEFYAVISNILFSDFSAVVSGSAGARSFFRFMCRPFIAAASTKAEGYPLLKKASAVSMAFLLNNSSGEHIRRAPNN